MAVKIRRGLRIVKPGTVLRKEVLSRTARARHREAGGGGTARRFPSR
jgi:hypothetical protein